MRTLALIQFAVWDQRSPRQDANEFHVGQATMQSTLYGAIELVLKIAMATRSFCCCMQAMLLSHSKITV